MTVCCDITALLINWRCKLPAVHLYSDTYSIVFPQGYYVYWVYRGYWMAWLPCCWVLVTSPVQTEGWLTYPQLESSVAVGDMHIPLEVAVGIPTSLCIEKDTGRFLTPTPIPFIQQRLVHLRLNSPKGFWWLQCLLLCGIEQTEIPNSYWIRWIFLCFVAMVLYILMYCT